MNGLVKLNKSMPSKNKNPVTLVPLISVAILLSRSLIGPTVWTAGPEISFASIQNAETPVITEDAKSAAGMAPPYKGSMVKSKPNPAGMQENMIAHAITLLAAPVHAKHRHATITTQACMLVAIASNKKGIIPDALNVDTGKSAYLNPTKME